MPRIPAPGSGLDGRPADGRSDRDELQHRRNKGDRYDHTEYGGGEGIIPRYSDGSGVGGEIPLKAVPSRNGDAARVVRQVGVRGDYDGAREDRPSDTNSREAIERITNGYGKNAPGYGERLQ